MPKNKGKGGKNRRRGKNENECVATSTAPLLLVTNIRESAMRSANLHSRKKVKSTLRFSRCWGTADSKPWYALSGHTKLENQRLTNLL